MLSATLSKAYQRLKEGRPGEALPLLERLVEELPTYVTPYVLMAWAYEAQEAWAEALESWQRAYFLMPNSPAVRQGLQRVMKATGDEKAAAAFAHTEPPETKTDSKQAKEAGTAEEPPADRETEPVLEHLPFDLSEEVQRSPREQVGEVEDLERLIDNLEDARIEPEPNPEEVPEPDLDDEIDDVVSETLARIYVTQERYADAAAAYRQLAEQKPRRADEFRQMAVELQRRADEV